MFKQSTCAYGPRKRAFQHQICCICSVSKNHQTSWYSKINLVCTPYTHVGIYGNKVARHCHSPAIWTVMAWSLSWDCCWAQQSRDTLQSMHPANLSCDPLSSFAIWLHEWWFKFRSMLMAISPSYPRIFQLLQETFLQKVQGLGPLESLSIRWKMITWFAMLKTSSRIRKSIKSTSEGNFGCAYFGILQDP